MMFFLLKTHPEPYKIIVKILPHDYLAICKTVPSNQEKHKTMSELEMLTPHPNDVNNSHPDTTLKSRHSESLPHYYVFTDTQTVRKYRSFLTSVYPIDTTSEQAHEPLNPDNHRSLI